MPKKDGFLTFLLLFLLMTLSFAEGLALFSIFASNREALLLLAGAFIGTMVVYLVSILRRR